MTEERRRDFPSIKPIILGETRDIDFTIQEYVNGTLTNVASFAGYDNLVFHIFNSQNVAADDAADRLIKSLSITGSYGSVPTASISFLESHASDVRTRIREARSEKLWYELWGTVSGLPTVFAYGDIYFKA